MTPIIALIVGLLAVGFLIMAIVKLFACTHSWEFVDKTEFPPPIEAATKCGASTVWMSDIPRMSRKTMVIVIRCPKCGEAKVLRETH